MRFKPFSLFLTGLLLFPILSTAQNLRTLNAYEIESSIQIDGRLDEEAWQHADTAIDFQQFTPDEGAPATQQSEVKILYGEGSVYIGAVLYDENPEDIERALARRDDYNRADWFRVSIDSYFDRQNAYAFGVSAAGTQYDAIQTGGGVRGMDTSWDAIWYSEVSITSEGWIVEMEIPYSMLRFSNAANLTWGIHFTRRIPRLGEVSEWPMVPRVERDNLIASFGELREIRNIEPRPNIQFRPYTVSRLNRQENLNTPGSVLSSTSFDAGGDLKIGLSPNVTLDATINPDFGQVEADPAELNLSAFETFFDEQRPFFVEGFNIYEFSVGRGELLYTRRIGAQNPIIGATKLSGRTDKGTSFGFLGAVTGDDFNPSNNYGVGRVSQQIGDYSSIGSILTFFDSPYSRGDGRRRSYSGGSDWDFRFLDNNYGIEGFASFTHRTLTAKENSETGFAGRLWSVKRQGQLTGFTGVDVFSDTFNPNDIGQLRANNYIVGLSRVEYQINRGQPFGLFQQAKADFFGRQGISYDKGLDLGMSLNFGSEWTLKTFQSFEIGFSFDNIFGGYDLFETRGLGPWAEPLSFGIELEYETDERRSWQLSPEIAGSFFDNGGRQYSTGMRGNVNVGSRLSFMGNVEIEWERGVVAWAANESFRRRGSDWLIGKESAPPTRLSPEDYVLFDDKGLLDSIFEQSRRVNDNTYYAPVFGARDTRSIDFTVRSTITFIQNLSLQFYGQYFMARGKYDNFQILDNRDNLSQFDPYPKRDEFSLNSFQSNTVLRWEYRPGATFFLVWSHGRFIEERINPLAPFADSPYEKQFGDQIRDVFDIIPNNTFMIKLDYTFLY